MTYSNHYESIVAMRETREPALARMESESRIGHHAFTVVCSYGGVAHFGGDDGTSERPLPLAGCASLSSENRRFS